MNVPKSSITRLSQVFRRLNTTAFRNGASQPIPELSQPVDHNNRTWPLDPRGEQIRTAKARRLGINSSVQKLNLVAKLVRNLSITEAHRQLAGCSKKVSPFVAATIQAAVTNARAFGLAEDRLVVSEAFVTKGVYLRRMRPWHGKGRFGIEHKKYAHLTVKVRELDEELWEATVMPRYVHMKRSNYARDDDRNHSIHKSSSVSWVSDLDEGLRKTKENVLELRAALKATHHAQELTK